MRWALPVCPALPPMSACTSRSCSRARRCWLAARLAQSDRWSGRWPRRAERAPDFADQLRTAAPDGVDVYFDNVGGPMLATVMPLMKRGGLVLISGLMAQYQGNAFDGADNLPVVLEAVMAKGVRIQSFSQYGQDALRPAFAAEIAGLVADGRLNAPIHVQKGMDRLPHALVGLFTQSLTGKVVVRVADPSTAAARHDKQEIA